MVRKYIYSSKIHQRGRSTQLVLLIKLQITFRVGLTPTRETNQFYLLLTTNKNES